MNLAGETEVLRGNLPRTAAVGSQRLTAWTMARLVHLDTATQDFESCFLCMLWFEDSNSFQSQIVCREGHAYNI
jgi:hypothetical protein